MVLDGYGQTIRNSLIHGVAVDLIAKGLVGLCNGGPGKAHKGCRRERLPQNLCIGLGHQCFHVLVGILAELDLFGVFQLCPVGFIREADDVAPVVDQPDLILFAVAELLNGADVETAALTLAQFVPELGTVFDHSHLPQIQKFLTSGKEFGTLLLQVLPVYDHHDGGRANFGHIRAAQCQLPGKKRHGVGLAAAGSTKIGATFPAAAFDRLYNAILQQPCRKKLRIAADDLHLAAVVDTILKIDVIPEDLQKTGRTINAVDQSFGFRKRQRRDFVAILHTPPCVEMLIRGTHRAKAGLDPIGDAGKGAVVQQVRDVPPVANGDLLPSIVNGRIGGSWVFQFNNAQRHSVHEQQNVRAAGLFLSVVGVLHNKLVHSPENVLFRPIIIDEGHHPCQTVLGHKLDAEHHPAVQLVQGGKIAFAACKMHGIVELVDLPGSQVWGILFQKFFEVRFQQHFMSGRTGERIACRIRPSGFFQKAQKGIFVFRFAVVAVIVL